MISQREQQEEKHKERPINTLGNGHTPPVKWDEFSLLSTTMRTYFAVLSFPLSADPCWQLTTNLTWWENHELCAVCLCDAAFLGEAESIQLHVPHCCVCISQDLCHACEPWQRAEETGAPRGAAARSVLTLSRARAHPASPLSSMGDTHCYIPLSGTD